MYFAKRIMIKENGYWTDKTDYKPLNKQAFKGNIPVMVQGNNWNIQPKKITLTGGL